MGKHVSNHIREMEQFLEQSSHIKTVLSSFDNLETTNRNDLYEIVSARKQIEAWLAKEIVNEDIKNDLEALLQSINLILNTLSEDMLSKIMNNNITKDKYGNKKKFKGLTDPKKLEHKRINILSRYIFKSAALLLVVPITLMIASNKDLITNIAKSVECSLSNAFNIEENIEYTLEINESIDNTKDNIEAVLENNKLTGDITHIKNFNTNIIGYIISTLGTLLVLLVSVRLVVDIAYMMIPIIRDKGSKFVSDDVKELVALEANSAYSTTEEECVDCRDKFEIAEALLHSTEVWMDNVRYLNRHNIDKSLRSIKNDIDIIENTIEDINRRIKGKDNMEIVEAHVDAEILYNKYKYDIDKYLFLLRLNRD